MRVLNHGSEVIREQVRICTAARERRLAGMLHPCRAGMAGKLSGLRGRGMPVTLFGRCAQGMAGIKLSHRKPPAAYGAISKVIYRR
eukprot:909104-Prymnesium_polylepis.1